MKEKLQVKCPTCREKGTWFEGDFGPFCSKRCKWVDFGKWFEEEMVISENLRPDMFQGYAGLPPGTYLDDPDQDPYGTR
ncbi:DNA gyrase inhibitor YacG [bacterium]|nr:DNA gyrase inhibitor YacG [bacterium]